MPKVIADGWHLNNNQAWFFFGFTTGAETSAFLMPPDAAKGLAMELDKRIKKYEAEVGPIDMGNFKTGIQSPFSGG